MLPGVPGVVDLGGLERREKRTPRGVGQDEVVGTDRTARRMCGPVSGIRTTRWTFQEVQRGNERSSHTSR